MNEGSKNIVLDELESNTEDDKNLLDDLMNENELIFNPEEDCFETDDVVDSLDEIDSIVLQDDTAQIFFEGIYCGATSNYDNNCSRVEIIDSLGDLEESIRNHMMNK